MVDFAKLLNREPKAYEVPGLLIGVTGHRPHKLNSRPGVSDGYEWGNPLRVRLRERLKEETLKLIERNKASDVALRKELSRMVAAEVATLAAAQKQDLSRMREMVKGECHYVVYGALHEATADQARAGELPRLKALSNRLAKDELCGRSRFSAMRIHSMLSSVRWNGPMPTGVVGVSGGALGADQDTCGVWYRMGIPYILAIPFPGQESRWPASSKKTYGQVVEKAAGVIYVSKTAPTTDKEAAKLLGERNGWVAGVSDEMLAVWNGLHAGGTADAVQQRFRIGGQIVLIDPEREREFI